MAASLYGLAGHRAARKVGMQLGPRFFTAALWAMLIVALLTLYLPF